MKIASDYSRLSFDELLDLDCVSYRILIRDAFVYGLKKTEEGREYLETCWLLRQTEPDRDKLRKQFSVKAV